MNKFAEQICDFYHASGQHNRLVKINHEKLLEYAKKLATQEPVAPNWREPKDVMAQDDIACVTQEFYRSVVNYCYVDPEAPKDKFQIGKYNGSLAMGFCFYRKFVNHAPPTKEIINTSLKRDEMADFFRGDTTIPLLKERRRMLLEAAEITESQFGGSPLNILKSYDYHVIPTLNLMLKIFPMAFGGDRVEVDTPGFQTLTFAKRAQLWLALYHGRALDSKVLTPLRDPERIGPIVDYQVPRSLRFMEILEYHPDLAHLVDSQMEIISQSTEEVAIRAATNTALVKLIEIINALRPEGSKRWTMVELDFALWSAAKGCPQPHHLTLTTDY